MKRGRYIHDEHSPVPIFLRIFHLREHVLEKKVLVAVDPRGSSAETVSITVLGLGLDSLVIHISVFAVGQVCEQVGKTPAAVPVVRSDCCRIFDKNKYRIYIFAETI